MTESYKPLVIIGLCVLAASVVVGVITFIRTVWDA